MRNPLRRRYGLHVQVGLLASLILALAAFAAPLRPGDRTARFIETADPDPIEPIDITVHDAPKPPSPPVEVNDPDIETPELDIDIAFDPAPAVIPPPPAKHVEEEPAEEAPEEVIGFVFVEDQPELIGGLASLRPEYPELARRANIEGTAFVQFVVRKDGAVRDAVCTRDPGGGLCEAALAAVRTARFTPGAQRGRPVPVRMTLPVRFKLR